MANSYDQINKLKDKYTKEIEAKDSIILDLSKKVDKLDSEVKELRKKLYDAHEGKGEQHRLQKIIKDKERDNKTLTNQLKELDGSKLISTFSKERQQLIKNIKNLKYDRKIFNALATRFINGLDDVIEIAAKIKNNSAEDLDFYTFVFRDNIVGLLEKIFKTILNRNSGSASQYLENLSNGNYQFPKQYLDRIPNLKNKVVLNNMMYLCNVQTVGYHGTKNKYKRVIMDKETNTLKKTDKFFNLDNESQLTAIFTLLEFMYDVFHNSDYEVNLSSIANNWFITI